MRPDWTSIVLGSNSDYGAADLDAEVLGYYYYPGGKSSGAQPVQLLRESVAHYAPYPDPLANHRGMSWLTPVIREVAADNAATSHKLAFFQNGATPNMVVKRHDTLDRTAFGEWVKLMEEGHAGAANAYKTLYLSEGADATVVGKDLQQLDFKLVQGAGETRIASAAGIHPVILGLSEGLAGSSLNAGNFASARRLVADKTLWHLWGNMAGSLETIVPPPGGSRLWVDGRDIPFLREDRKDAAEIQQVKAQSIRQLTDAGFTATSAVAAVEAENMSLLVHSGLFSVQLQPPGTTAPDVTPPDQMPTPPTNAPTGGPA
jgi:phage portal protein BeeE